MRLASSLRPATLALASALAWTLAGCQRETRTVEQNSPPPAQPTEVAQVTPPAPPPVAQPAPPAPAPGESPATSTAEPDRRAAELGQSSRTVVIQPEAPRPSARRESLAARERRLAARQAELDRREQRLRDREARQSEPSPAPAPAEEPAASDAAPVPAPEPEPAPAPEATVTVPAGTSLDVELSQTLSSATSRVGETFRARIAKDVLDGDGAVVIPAGAEVVGEVSQAVPLNRKIGGQASLGLHFTDLVLPSGETVPIQASLQRSGPSKTGRDAATIGGATAGGAILGNILSRGSRGRGSVIGALIGAAAGTAIAARTKGEEVEIPRGTVVGLLFDQSVRVHRRE